MGQCYVQNVLSVMLRFNVLVFWWVGFFVVVLFDFFACVWLALSSRSRGGGNYTKNLDDYKNEQIIYIHIDSHFVLNGNKLTGDGVWK